MDHLAKCTCSCDGGLCTPAESDAEVFVESYADDVYDAVELTEGTAKYEPLEVDATAYTELVWENSLNTELDTTTYWSVPCYYACTYGPHVGYGK